MRSESHSQSTQTERDRATSAAPTAASTLLRKIQSSLATVLLWIFLQADRASVCESARKQSIHGRTWSEWIRVSPEVAATGKAGQEEIETLRAFGRAHLTRRRRSSPCRLSPHHRIIQLRIDRDHDLLTLQSTAGRASQSTQSLRLRSTLTNC